MAARVAVFRRSFNTLRLHLLQKQALPKQFRLATVHSCCVHKANYLARRNNYHTTCVNCKTLPFKLSDIGEGIAEVTVKEWYVEIGSKVNQFDSICEVQSDKASVTITSKYDGVIKKIYYEVDDMARVGTTLVDIEVVDDKEAEVDEDDQHLLESEPVTPPLPDTRQATQKQAITNNEIQAEPISSQADIGAGEGKKALAAPAVRRLAMEHNLKLSQISGTGKEGRVLKEDILQYLENPRVSVPTAQQPSVAAKSSPPKEVAIQTPVKRPSITFTATKQPVEDRQEKLSGIGKAMVKSMQDALEIPHFGYCDEISCDSLIRVRHDLKVECEEHGIKLSFMPFFIKATSMALEKFPVLNSSLNKEESTITYKGVHNVGVAMDTSDGLLVPNVKDVANKSLLEIAAELNELHNLGLTGKLGPNHLTGGTISLSNIGSIGGTYAKPVVLPPQVAIAAIGKIQRLPRFDQNGQVYAANIFNISWSADHRVIEGAVMARFSNLWKSYIENPSTMLLQLR